MDRLGKDELREPAPPLHDRYRSAYEPEIQVLLARVSEQVEGLSRDFVSDFYEKLPGYTSASSIFDLLTKAEFIALKKAQASHLQTILSPTLEMQRHIDNAERMARAHEMVGVDLPALLEAYHIYQDGVREFLASLGLNDADRLSLMGAIEKRLLLDLEVQITEHYKVDMELAAFVEQFDNTMREVDTLPDLLDRVMQAILQLDGIVAGLFLRPDAHGDLLIEATGGIPGQAYADAMHRNEAPYLHTSSDIPAGQGPAGRAWRTTQIQTTQSYELQSDLEPWKEIGVSLGFRSNVAIPLLDENDRPFALLTLYSSWPGFFDTRPKQILLRHIQNSLSHAVLHFERDVVVSIKDRQIYCDLLSNEYLDFYLQPIIELKTGGLSHLEALARLRRPDGSLISPGQFLPVCGKSDLYRLFKMGLDRVVEHLALLNSLNIQVPISINLPPDGLIEDGYKEVLFKYLSSGKINRNLIMLEILETRDPSDSKKRDRHVSEFRREGISIIQDDLGSGHSSLLRMENLNFDQVKIDQGLVRSASKNPQRAMEFIYHLTRLAHGFGIPVTIEGLESKGLIEASAVLGANYGQGYGIGHPMPIQDVAPWHKHFSCSLNPRKPETAIGALAGYLLWDRQLAALADWPDLIEDFIHAPCHVQQYLDHSTGLSVFEKHKLQDLLKHNHACAINGNQSAMYQRTRKAVIAELGRFSLYEKAS